MGHQLNPGGGSTDTKLTPYELARVSLGPRRRGGGLLYSFIAQVTEGELSGLWPGIHNSTRGSFPSAGATGLEDGQTMEAVGQERYSGRQFNRLG